MSAPEATLRERIVRRRQRGDDASEATIEVLDAQRRAYEPLDVEEQRFVVPWEAGGSQDTLTLPAAPILDALQRSAMHCGMRSDDGGGASRAGVGAELAC